ncbi:protein yellow-like [Lycorma delicatula]|uniref:protein yellow-like n=1 Tax=Lycorma delicatula TaxID=130591 RepID=UPI003F510180
MNKEDLIILSVITVTFLLSKCSAMNRNPMQTAYSWKIVDYVFPNNSAPDTYKLSRQYVPENVLILDASVWQGQGKNRKVFVSTPRLRNGIPASFSIVSSKLRNNANLLQPYPDWSWHRPGDCNGMTSVFRSTIDACGRLWVLDTGFLHAENKQVCPPQILIFDLNTDRLTGRYVFPKSVVKSDSLLITIVTDVRDSKCKDVFAYIADVTDFKLIVFDERRKASWNIDSHLFYPYPLQGVFNINGITFDLMDGIFGLALGPFDKNNDRKLYFHSLASVRESWVYTSVIRNESLFENGENKSPRSFHVFEGTRSSQSASEAMTDDGVLFFGLLSKNSIACWNSMLPYTETNIETVAKDDSRLQFSSGLKVHNGNVWATTSRFHHYFTGVMNHNDINFRILVAPVHELVIGTSCSIITNRYPGTTSSPFRPFPTRGGSYSNSSYGSNKPVVFET